jgi:hypothetical protein
MLWNVRVCRRGAVLLCVQGCWTGGGVGHGRRKRRGRFVLGLGLGLGFEGSCGEKGRRIYSTSGCRAVLCFVSWRVVLVSRCCARWVVRS